MTATAADDLRADTLGVNVFTAPAKAVVGERPRPFGEPLGWDPITSTLIYGEYDAVLVDTLTTVAEATALADWVALHHRNLTTIYITHGHFDHFFGLSVLLNRFPSARAIATPKSVELMHQQLESGPWMGSFGDGGRVNCPRRWQRPNRMRMTPSPWRATNCASSSRAGPTPCIRPLCTFPAIDLVVGGDVLYNQCHIFVGATHCGEPAELDRGPGPPGGATPEDSGRRAQETGAPDLPSAIEDTKRYLQDFGRLTETATSDRELFDEMTGLYPDWVSNQSWLMFGLPLPKSLED